MIAVTVVALAGFGALVVYPKLTGGASMLPRAAMPILYLDSQPSGATVRINGHDIGRTPLVQHNLYGSTEVSFQLLLKGYRPYAGTFRGGETTKVEARLSRK